MKIRTAASLATVLLGSACSGIIVHQDFNRDTEFSGLRTWDWMPNPTQPTGDRRADNAITGQRIQSAIEASLLEKGFTKAEAGEPDFRVGFQVVLNDRVDFQTVNQYWGPGWGYGGIYGGYGYGYGMPMGTTHTYAQAYTQGSLIIDFFDVEAHELVWRGTAEGKLHQYTDPVKKQERANQIVKKILGQFPPRG